MYIYVERGDVDLDYMTLQLGDIAQFDPPQGIDAWQPVGDKCASTASIVCLKSGIKEGQTGQYFYAPHLTIPISTAQSNDPYYITASAITVDGSTTTAQLPLFVSDDKVSDKPKLIAATAISATETQVLLSAPIDPTTIDNSACRISPFDSINDYLMTKNIKISADSRSLTIRTNGMPPSTLMSITCDATQLGLKVAQAGDNRATFDSYDQESANRAFVIESVVPTSANAVEVTMSKPLDFTSVRSNGKNFAITQKDNDRPLDITAARITAAKTITVSTSAQQPGVTYIFKAQSLVDAFEKDIRNGGHIRTFDGYSELHGAAAEVTESGSTLFHQADLDKSGKIDFLDFSIFSNVYNTTTTTLSNGTKPDMNDDGKVDFLDFSIFSQYYGITYP